MGVTIPSLQVVALLPTDKFWKLNESLIVTPQKSYSLGNLKEFFHDINFPEGWDFYMDTKSLVYDLIPPKVNVSYHSDHHANAAFRQLLLPPHYFSPNSKPSFSNW